MLWVCVCLLVTRPCLTVIPWTIAHQALLATGFSRQESWSGWPCPPPGALPKPGVEPRSPTLQADSLRSEPPGKPMNTGVGSLSLLQGFFLTQQSNQGTSLYIFYHRMQEVGCGFFTIWGFQKNACWTPFSAALKLK